MKKLLLITLLGVALNCKAQYSDSFYNPPKGWGSVELVLPVAILGGTFASIEILDENITSKQRGTIAFTGLLTSTATHLVFRYAREHEIFKKTKNLIVNTYDRIRQKLANH